MNALINKIKDIRDRNQVEVESHFEMPFSFYINFGFIILVIIFEVMGELEAVMALLLVLVTLPEVRYLRKVAYIVFLVVEPHPSL